MNLNLFQKKLDNQLTGRLAFKLNQVCNLLNGLYDINAGGCCYIAYIIAKLLLDDGFASVKLVILSNSDLSDCETINDVPKSQDHYVIRVGNQFINADDYDLDDYSEFEFNVTKANFILDHYNKCRWNDTYSPLKNKTVAKILKNFHDDFIEDLRQGRDSGC